MPRADDAVRELLRRIAALEDTYAEPFVVPFERCRARRKVFAQAEQVRLELARPIAIKPWTPWNPESAE